MLTKAERDKIRDVDFVRCDWGRIFRIVEQLCNTSDELEAEIERLKAEAK